jgi:Na+/alanine symporter
VPKRQRIDYLKNFALSLLIVPVVILPFLVFFAVTDPEVVIEAWDIYLIFFGVPWTIAAIILLLRKRML